MVISDVQSTRAAAAVPSNANGEMVQDETLDDPMGENQGDEMNQNEMDHGVQGEIMFADVSQPQNLQPPPAVAPPRIFNPPIFDPVESAASHIRFASISSEAGVTLENREWVSTGIFENMIITAIQSAPNNKRFAFLSPFYFRGAHVQLQAAHIINYDPSVNEFIFMPYCDGMHHRLFVFERTKSARRKSVMHHYDPYGPPPQNHTRISRLDKRQAQLLINAIEQKQVQLLWDEPNTPAVFRQPGGNGVDCGIVTMDYIRAIID